MSQKREAVASVTLAVDMLYPLVASFRLLC